MSPRRHVDDLFSAAYENDLSPIDDARFHSHLQSCAPCATAFAEFTASVEALRELPPARMPHAVHLPSTPPVAERAPRERINLRWLNLGLLRRFPATAAAAAVAAVLVIIAVTHGTGTGTTIGADSNPALGAGSSAHAPGPVAETASCSQPVVRVTGSALPDSFSAQQQVSVPSQPGVRLVLATSSLDVAAGRPVDVYAQLVVPASSLAAPGAAPGTGSSLTFRPCVTIGVEGTSLALVPATYGASVPVGVPQPATGDTTGPAAAGAPGGSELITFDIPSGLAPGTKLHLTATVPAGYEGYGTPELTATLTLTTH